MTIRIPLVVFSMILPTYPGKIPQTSPNPNKERKSFINCWWNIRGIFQGYVGGILDVQVSLWRWKLWMLDLTELCHLKAWWLQTPPITTAAWQWLRVGICAASHVFDVFLLGKRISHDWLQMIAGCFTPSMHFNTQIKFNVNVYIIYIRTLGYARITWELVVASTPQNNPQ